MQYQPIARDHTSLDWPVTGSHHGILRDESQACLRSDVPESYAFS